MVDGPRERREEVKHPETTLCYYCQQPGADTQYKGEPYHRRCVKTVRDTNYE